MNRAQRRKKAKGKALPPDSHLRAIAQREAYAYTDKIKSELVDTMTPQFIALFAMVLHDDFGFGGKRLSRVISRVYELSDSMAEGYLSPSDVAETIKMETGVDIFDMA